MLTLHPFSATIVDFASSIYLPNSAEFPCLLLSACIPHPGKASPLWLQHFLQWSQQN